MTIRLRKGSDRNTKAHVVEINCNEYFFSYETCIAFRGNTGPDQYVSVRIANSWGPTTGRHFKEMGCSNFKTIPNEEFEAIISASVTNQR